jgi:hypothetical protein
MAEQVMVGHPSSDCSRPSTLNLEFLLDELLEKKVYLVDMSILSITLRPRPGCHRRCGDRVEASKEGGFLGRLAYTGR